MAVGVVDYSRAPDAATEDSTSWTLDMVKQCDRPDVEFAILKYRSGNKAVL